MIRFRIIAVLVLCLLFPMASKAEGWRTHFAYNNVTQIALGSDKVFAVSDGSLFSVEKQSEKIAVYNRLSGLHETGITCIYYDSTGKQLLIAYGNGKIDILRSKEVVYLGELYDKDMTQRKTIYNVTLKGRTAYLSTHYGIQTLDLREKKLVDSYWLQPGGVETPVKDVKLTNDSIYAFTDDLLYCASLRDPLSDYHYWRSEPLGRISRDIDKGVHYKDGINDWYAGQSEGIIRVMPTGRFTYKPQGPLVNTPYRLRATGGKLGMIQGSYSVYFGNRPGAIMFRQNSRWTNIDASSIASQAGLSKVNDMCDIVFDPSDPSHFFASSFGYGLFEFKNNAFHKHYNPSNSALEYVLNTSSYPYLWVDGLQYDADGNLWMLNNSNNGVKVLQKNGQWVAISNAACQNLDRSKDLLISVKNPHIKLISGMKDGVGVFDDKGTISKQSDDRAVLCKIFQDNSGNIFELPRISSFYQTKSGILLVGTENGLFRIDEPEAMLDGYRICTSVIEEEHIRSITEDEYNNIWIGTQTMGVYCMSADLREEVAHFSTENSPMPSNDVLSLCWMSSNDRLFIGTAEGLVEYGPNGIDDRLDDHIFDEEEDLKKGRILQWTLHPSYYNMKQVVVTPKMVYGRADGSLFSVDKEDEHIDYWNKSTGLSGSSATHIAYDASSKQLIIAYEDGQIDLLSDDQQVTPMPDIAMKAGKITVHINAICVGKRHTYLAMDFGILAINTKKAEISDTYYIGEEASSIAVQEVIEDGDSLYAFSSNRLYRTSLKEHPEDYSYWQHDSLPFEVVKQAAAYKGTLYALSTDSILYRREGKDWIQALPDSLVWFRVSGDQLIVFARKDQHLSRLKDDGRLELIDNYYYVRDGVYAEGAYWLAVSSRGVVRLQDGKRNSYIPDGPISNFGYHMDVAHNQIYVAPGGRWATRFARAGYLSIYNGSRWRTISHYDIQQNTNHNIHDAVQYAVDPNDPGHFFLATYATGVFEFKDYTAVQHYDSANSTLRRLAPGVSDYYYTCTDGALWDDQGNFWVINTTSIGKPLHVRTPQGQWKGLPLRSGGKNLILTTPTGIWMDRRNSQWKWMMDQRGETCLILLNDGGTPTISSDDRCMARSTFVDQNGNQITPSYFRCFAQDHKNRIWIGTDQGLLIIPEEVDFFTSNACQRIIIPRNDGTGLGDYLLGDEQINCLAVDGGNRLWIGTNNSGLYLIQDDTITVAHFTETNSMLPSNSILSVAILPNTGEVFAGTDNGIASYMSDASEAKEDMNGAYAFPNPVRPDYGGYISITGLMDNSEVNIVDSGGNLVCKTRSQGGTAVWDGRLPDGRRATAGVYTALCNAVGGHAAVKILVIR